MCFLFKSKRPAVVCALAELRGRWMRDPDSLIRAARHYEGAAQKLISNSVWTASQFIQMEKIQAPPCEVRFFLSSLFFAKNVRCGRQRPHRCGSTWRGAGPTHHHWPSSMAEWSQTWPSLSMAKGLSRPELAH